MIWIIIGCLIIIGFLGFKLYQKQTIDRVELIEYNDQLKLVKQEVQNQWTEFQLASDNLEAVNRALARSKEDTEYEKHKLEECRKDLQAALEIYQDITDNKLSEINDSMEEQRRKRQEDLDMDFVTRKNLLEATLEKYKQETNNEIQELNTQLEECRILAEERMKECALQVAEEQEKVDNIQRILRQYDADKQAKLYYTIQLPEEYQEDIEYLLTTVAAKVQHPDIISKLVWAEYVKPNLDNTFKRIDIHPEPGIYKLTSLIDSKCYIGKSTNVKNRISDHFKSAVGIKSIADQAVHHAILKEGFWNWQIEIITYCDKDKLNEFEKYYIEFFKSKDYGYNKIL